MSDPTELLKGTTPGPAMPGTHRHSIYVWFVDGLKGPFRGDCADPGCDPASRARELVEARAEIEALRGHIAGPVAFSLWISEQTLTVRRLRKAEVLEWLLSVKHRAIRASRGELDRACLTTDACVLDGRHGKEWQEEARRALGSKPSGGGP